MFSSTPRAVSPLSLIDSSSLNAALVPWLVSSPPAKHVTTNLPFYSNTQLLLHGFCQSEVVQSLGPTVRMAFVTKHHHVTGCYWIFVWGTHWLTRGTPTPGQRWGGVGLLFLGSPEAPLRLQSAALGLRWLGHASSTALILCLFVKGQNMRLPNKI